MSIRNYIGRLNFISGKNREQSDLRQLAAGTAKLARSGMLPDFISGMTAFKGRMEQRMDSWLEPEDIKAGRAGAFDVCDLRVWLLLAEKAGVDCVPAKELVQITHAELDALTGPIKSQTDLFGKVKLAYAKAGSDAKRVQLLEHLADLNLPKVSLTGADVEDLRNRMTDVMDEIPPSWMVRTNFSGSSNLKALVGTGLMLKGDDTAEIAQGLKLGAGWFQMGNSRTIDYADRRFIELAAMHKPVITYLARPWAQPARFHEGEDLHRANSPLAGPGKWPAEWRCFVKNGRVTGVANYYGWTGEGATPTNAWNAIEAGALAQQVCDTAIELGLHGEFTDTFRMFGSRNERDIKAMAGWDERGLHASLDFIETADGLRLLEAGPGHIPGGGGHPCAFAGQGVDPAQAEAAVALCDGVAYRNMSHVDLGDPKTWKDGNSVGAISSWEDAYALAIQHDELSDRAKVFLERKGINLPSDANPEPQL